MYLHRTISSAEAAKGTGSDLSKKKQGVVNLNRKVAKVKGTLQVGVIKGSMGVQPPTPPPDKSDTGKEDCWHASMIYACGAQHDGCS